MEIRDRIRQSSLFGNQKMWFVSVEIDQRQVIPLFSKLNSVMAGGLVREIPNVEQQKYHRHFESDARELLPRFSSLEKKPGKAGENEVMPWTIQEIRCPSSAFRSACMANQGKL
jgi:hypothetical protein